MPSTSNNASHIFNFLAAAGINYTGDLSFSHYYEDYNLELKRKGLSDEAFRQLKQLFGPFQILDSYGSKNFKGSYTLASDIKINLTISSVYVCTIKTIVEVQAMSPQDWADYKANVEAGVIKIQSCTPTNSK